jgi:SAM-dependent methyltransferase
MNTYKDYKKNYSLIAQNDLEESIEPLDHLMMKAKIIFKFARLNIDTSGDTIAEIGPGKGFLLNEMIAGGIKPENISIIDIAPQYLASISHQNVIRILANAEKLDIKERFSFLICTDVAEHVLNLANLMFSINRALKQDGVLLLGVPYRENLLPYAHQLGCKYEFAHLRTFDLPLIKDLLLYSGFKLIKYKKVLFHIKGPRTYIKRFRILRNAYGECVSFLEKLGLNNQWFNKFVPKVVLNLFLKPTEVMILAKKQKILTQENMYER